MGADKIAEAYRAFVAFFANDESVGFEASMGIAGGAAVSAGDLAGGVTLEAKAGLEDVDDKDAQAFAELGFEILVRDENNQVKIRVSKRWREGSNTVTIDVKTQFSVARALANADTGRRVLRNVALGFNLLFGEVASTREGGAIQGIGPFATSVLDIAGSFGARGRHLDHLVGIDFQAQQNDGQWDKVSARFKNMTQLGTGTGNRIDLGAAKVEANIAVGQFIDLSAELKDAVQS